MSDNKAYTPAEAINVPFDAVEDLANSFFDGVGSVFGSTPPGDANYNQDGSVKSYENQEGDYKVERDMDGNEVNRYRNQ